MVLGNRLAASSPAFVGERVLVVGIGIVSMVKASMWYAPKYINLFSSTCVLPSLNHLQAN